MNKIYIDFETHFDKNYSLTKMTTPEYICDPRFKVLGVAYAVNDEPQQWSETLPDLDWENSEVIAFNAMFDCMILTLHYGIKAKRYCCTLSLVRYFKPHLNAYNLKSVAPTLGIGEKTEGLTEGGHEADDKLIDYALNDNELNRKIYKLIDIPEAEREVLHITLRWAVEPTLVGNIEQLRKAADEAEAERQRILEASGLSKEVLASAKKFGTYIERELGLEMPRGGKLMGYIASKGDPAFQKLMADNPNQKHIWDARLACKSTINIDRPRTIAAVCEATGGPLPMPLKWCGAHCVPGDTEILTSSGWIAIKDWDQSNPIAQYSLTGEIYFDHAAKYIGPVIDKWINVDAYGIKCQFTYGHTIPHYLNRNGEISTIKAGELLERNGTSVPVLGCYECVDGALNEHQMRVLVMTQADGNFNVRVNRATALRYKFVKPRKIARAKQLLTAAGVPYTDRGTTMYVAARDIPAWLVKRFGPHLLDSSYEARKAFIEELTFWDGHESSEHKQFTSIDKSDIDWAQIICHLTGQAATITQSLNKSGTTQYTLSIKRRNPGYTVVKKKHVSSKQVPQQSYCCTTKTGFWVARANNKVFVTGNTTRWSGQDGYNVQNLPNGSTARTAIEAPPGYVIVVCDSSQIELRVNAWYSKEKHVLETLYQGKDVYISAAAMMFGRSYESIEKDSKERKLGKAAVLGSGYGMGWTRFKEWVASGPLNIEPMILTDKEAQGVINGYRAGHPNIKQNWENHDSYISLMANIGKPNKNDFKKNRPLIDPKQVGPVLIEKEKIILPNGLALSYEKLRSEEVGENIAWIYGNGNYIYGARLQENVVQALARVVISDQLLAIEAAGIRTVSSTHDEIIAVCPENEAENTYQKMVEIMSTTPKWAQIEDYPELKLAAEGGYARNYSK